MSNRPICHHGMTKARGCPHAAVSRFGRLVDLPGLPVTEARAALLGGPGGLMHDFDGESANSPIPAGYIFFAQFIDHDITLDAESKLRGDPLSPAEIGALPNVRSPSLDLDCVYGFGPEASPHIYDPGRPGHLAVADNGRDLARSPGGVALIGDPRNDENIFVGQLQLLFHRLHNRLYAERVQPDHGDGSVRFEEAQRETRYHYQWLVLFDLLKRLCNRKVYIQAVEALLAGDAAFPYLHRPDAHGELVMPVEFSVAAYRVGHTLVRSRYAVNAANLDVELFDPRFDLRGFDAVPPELVVDWRYLLPVDPCVRPRPCKAVDPLLADALQNLPVVGSNNPLDRALAFRNLLRGNALSLPSGQDMAAKLAGVYPAIDPNFDPQITHPDPANKADVAALNKATPLFYYVLREAELLEQGQRLGPVGSAILMEVFGGMLRYCTPSIITDKAWAPDPCVAAGDDFDRLRCVREDGYFPFQLADVARWVG